MQSKGTLLKLTTFLSFELFWHMKTCRGKLEHKHYVECLICTRLENCYTINMLSVKSELNFNLKVYGTRVMCGSSFLTEWIYSALVSCGSTLSLACYTWLFIFVKRWKKDSLTDTGWLLKCPVSIVKDQGVTVYFDSLNVFISFKDSLIPTTNRHLETKS